MDVTKFSKFYRFLIIPLLFVASIYLNVAYSVETLNLRPGLSSSTLVTTSVPEDIDGDGMPNEFEKKYGLNPGTPYDAVLDNDLDGLTNLEEYNIGTDPSLPDSDGGSLIDLEEMKHIKNPLDPKDDNDYTLNPIIDPSSTLDSDGDLIKDFDEIYKYFTNPYSVDSDLDGLTDFSEIFTHSTDPNNFDTDFDGLTDSQEVKLYLTNPLLWDSDSGGDPDGDEIHNKTNPLKKDDDLGYFWRIYLGKEYHSGVSILNVNKVTTVKGVNLTLEVQKPADIEYILVKLDGSTTNVLRGNKENLVFITPEEPGLYLLTINIPTSGKEFEYYRISRFIEVKPRGKIYRKIIGTFEDNYEMLINNSIVPGVQIDISKYHPETKKGVRYVSEYFNQNSPVFSDSDGSYALLLDPGTYKIEFSKSLFVNEEIIINVNEPTILSDNMLMQQNLDYITWAGIFIITYTLVWYILNKFRHHIPDIKPSLRYNPSRLFSKNNSKND